MSKPSIVVTSQYRKASAVLRPSLRTSPAGRQYLRISRRAFRAAEARISYAGNDGVNIGGMPAVEGYGDWMQDDDGNVIAWQLVR